MARLARYVLEYQKGTEEGSSSTPEKMTAFVQARTLAGLQVKHFSKLDLGQVTETEP